MRHNSIEKMLVRFATHSFVVMFTCIAIAALVLGHAFIRQESVRAELGQRQLQNAFTSQLGDMSIETLTESYGAVALRLHTISEQLGNVPYEAYLFDASHRCIYFASATLPDGSKDGCHPAGRMIQALTALPQGAPSQLTYDDVENRYLFAAPLAVGSVTKGYLLASVADPFRFYRGGIFGSSSELLLPVLSAVVLIWGAWLVFAYQLYLKPYLKHLTELKKNEALIEIARKVAHDIRNPTSALEKLVYLAPQLPEELAVLFRSAIRQINDTANNLLSTGRVPSAFPPSVRNGVAEPVERIVRSVVSQMEVLRGEHSGVTMQLDIDPSATGAFAEYQGTELRQILSNILNNAFESFETPRSTGTIRIAALADESEVHLSITDTGKGIPENILPKLGQRGATFNKTKGNGLGLYHARTTLTSWGGALKLDSIEGEGTKVDITLRRTLPPSWFMGTLNIPRGAEVVLLDDQPLNHELLREVLRRTGAGGANPPMHSFYDPQTLRSWQQSRRKQGLGSEGVFYLCDFDLGQGLPNGLDVIRELGIAKSTVLITAQADSSDLQARCAAEQVRLIFRDDLARMPIVFGGLAGGH